MHKHIVLCVEGETEIEFYKELISFLKSKNNALNSKIKIDFINAEGIGGFKKKVLLKYRNTIQRRCQNCQPTIVLCYDLDVFENSFSSNPKVNIDDVVKSFSKEKVTQVIKIAANKCIEDWFLLDLQGVLQFLKLDIKTKIQGITGQEKLENLYKKTSKIYLKGSKSNKLIQSLNIELIYQKIKQDAKEIEILEKLFTF